MSLLKSIMLVSRPHNVWKWKFSFQGEALRLCLLTRYFEKAAQKSRDSISMSKRRGLMMSGPGSVMLSRAKMTLSEVQNHLDREGASDLVVDLITNNSSSRIFFEVVELGIALLEGGNSNVQRSFYARLTSKP